MTTSELVSLANEGNVDAMYNLGVIYSTGDGVKMDKPLAKFWYEKAAENGDADAKELLESMESTDALKRIAVSGKVLEAYMSFQIGRAGFEDAKRSYKKALNSSEEIWSPTSEDLLQRREIYRYLGMITYLCKDEDYLKESEAYYEYGLPVIETKDLRTAAFYSALMNALNRATGEKSYIKKCYDVADYIYKNRFADTEDNDIKFMFLQYMIGEKILGEVYPKDLDGAVRLNEVIRSLGNDFANEYEVNCKNINEARVAQSQNTNLETNFSKKRGLLGRIFR